VVVVTVLVEQHTEAALVAMEVSYQESNNRRLVRACPSEWTCRVVSGNLVGVSSMRGVPCEE